MSTSDRPDRDEVRRWLMAELDGELDGATQQELERRIREDPELARERESMRRVKEVTGMMTYREPPEEVWGTYWGSVYNRFERGVAWILASVGAIVLLAYGAWNALGGLWGDASVPLFVRLAVFALVMGGIILLVSVAREKWFTASRDPYKEIRR